MCGRYAIAYSSEELPSHFKSQHLPVNPKISKGEHHDRSYNVAPTTSGAVYRAKDSELRYMKWGLIPFWTKSLKDFKTYKTFNARLENLQESRMWSQCCKSKRCAIPLNGYYEWKTKGKKKIPYYVVRNDGKLGFVAGLYDYLESEDLWTYSIVTAQAPKELAWLHDRMPVVLEPGSEAWEAWMNPNKTDWTQDELDSLLAAHYDEKTLCVYQVSDEVNKVGRNAESMVKPIFKEDRDKFHLERFPEEEMKPASQDDEEPPTKRLKTEVKEQDMGQGLSGKIGGGYEVKKEQKGPMIEGDQEEDLKVQDTSAANEDESEEVFVKEDEDPDLEEEYLKQSDDEEIEEEDLENIGREDDDDEYIEGDDENDEASDYAEVMKGSKKGTRKDAGESIGERVKNEDTGRVEETEMPVPDITQQLRARKKATETPSKGDTGKSSAKQGSMSSSKAGKKGGRKSSHSSGSGDPDDSGSKGGKMSASEAGKRGGRRGSKSKDTGNDSSNWGDMNATEAGHKGGRMKKQHT